MKGREAIYTKMLQLRKSGVYQTSVVGISTLFCSIYALINFNGWFALIASIASFVVSLSLLLALETIVIFFDKEKGIEL